MSAPDLSIVIPAFNERRRIAATIAEWRRSFESAPGAWEVRVVDDGSSDETADVAAAAAEGDPRVVIQRERHRGKGGAVRAGMLASRARLRFLCDADLSMPIREFPKFTALVPSAADIAIGSREGAGARRVNEPGGRHVMGRTFNRLIQMAALPGLADTQCGFKLFSGPAADAIFTRVSIEGWAFDVEALIIARRLGFRVAVVPIEWHYRPESRVSPVRDALRMARDVLKIRARAAAGRYDG